MESSINFVVVDMPHASDFQLHIFAAMSQEERRQISLRTKESLRQAKLRGVVLGKYSKVLSVKNRQEAIDYSFKFKELIEDLMSKDYGYTRIAKYLNDNGYKTRQDKTFYSSTVKNMVGYY
jgi:DNA invertase Pin-like site-specific DNA recombinase